MINMIFEVSVRSFDKDSRQVKDIFRVFGRDTAIQYGLEFGVCDNVESVDVMDAFTGEVMLIIDHCEVTHLVES